jgi:hypothetical protein
VAVERAPRQYVALRGAHINNSDAQIVGPELDAIAAELGGIKPSDVINRAATPGTALNRWDTDKGYFEWDDESAADAFREGQARRLIRSVVIKVDTGSETLRTRAFYSIQTDSRARHYQSISEVAQDPEMVRQIRDRFQNELIRIDQSYRAYLSFVEFERDFGGVFAAIEEVVPQAKARAQKRGRSRAKARA